MDGYECACGTPILIETTWNGLAHIPVFYTQDGKRVSCCPACGEWLTLDYLRRSGQARASDRPEPSSDMGGIEAFLYAFIHEPVHGARPFLYGFVSGAVGMAAMSFFRGSGMYSESLLTLLMVYVVLGICLAAYGRERLGRGPAQRFLAMLIISLFWGPLVLLVISGVLKSGKRQG